MNIQVIQDGHCASIFVVSMGTFEERIRAWAIVGGTMALSLLDHTMTKRFNYCAERDSSIHDYKTWDGVAIEHFEGGADTIYNYTSKAIAQREVQNDRMKAIGPPRFSPVFWDEGNQCEFICEWNDSVTFNSLLTRNPKLWQYEASRIVSPIKVSSEYYGGRGEKRVAKYCDENWQKAIDLWEALPENIQLKELYLLTEEEFHQYEEISLVLSSYPTHPIKVFDS